MAFKRLEIPRERTLTDLTGLLHGSEENTKFCLLIVGPEKATALSPTIHGAAYTQMGLQMRYEPFPTADLEGVVKAMRLSGGRLRGASVGIPYKQAIMPLIGEKNIDETARAIGAVNTVVNVAGELHGFNSDWIGAQRSIEKVAELKPGQTAIVVGMGGAGRAVAYMLKKKGLEVTVYNRDPERAKQVAKDLGITFGGGLQELAKAERADVIVNTTSLGSQASHHVGESAIPLALLQKSKGGVAFDAVYLPRETRFLTDARASGMLVAYGDDMLLHQAVFQVEKFTGGKAPVDVMEKALKEYLAAL